MTVAGATINPSSDFKIFSGALTVESGTVKKDVVVHAEFVNPDDESAWNVLGIITPAADGPVYDDLRVEVDDNFQDQVCCLLCSVTPDNP